MNTNVWKVHCLNVASDCDWAMSPGLSDKHIALRLHSLSMKFNSFSLHPCVCSYSSLPLRGSNMTEGWKSVCMRWWVLSAGLEIIRQIFSITLAMCAAYHGTSGSCCGLRFGTGWRATDDKPQQLPVGWDMTALWMKHRLTALMSCRGALIHF